MYHFDYVIEIYDTKSSVFRIVQQFYIFKMGRPANAEKIMEIFYYKLRRAQLSSIFIRSKGTDLV